MDLDDSVRKLLRLGFENEQDVRAALKRTNLDVNQAITLLLTKRGSGCVGTLDASTIATVDQSCPSPGSDVSQIGGPYLTVEERPPIVGHDLCIEFSTAEFNCLQSRVYTDQWDIPCLRNQPLGKCIMGSIHMLRSVGLQALEDNSDCRQFVYICLSDCVTKLLNSQAVFNWDRETLEGVHNMLELAVRLICEYLAAFQRTLQSNMSAGSTAIDGGLAPSGCDEAVTTKLGLTTPRSAPAFTDWALHLLALIFDCEANYHQLCRDRSGSSGNYADPFNDWTSICQRRTTGSQAVYAEMLPSPRNFYLVNLVNCFGYFDGFRLLHWLGTQRWANISLMASVLSPLVHCADYLSAYTLRNERGLALMERALWRLSNLSEDDFKERDSKVFDLMTGLRVLTYRLIDLDLTGCLPFLTRSGATSGYQCPVEPDWESFEPSVTTSSSSNGTSPSFAITQVDKLHCTLLLSALSPPQGAARASFNGRMLAMRNLVEQLEAAKLSADMEPMQTRSEGRGHGMRRVPYSQSSSATLLASENATFLLRRNRRRAIRFEFLMTWFRESEVILKSMHNLDNTAYMTTLGQLFRLLGERITPEDITTVWNRTTNQPGAAMDNVLTLITDVASSRFTQPQLHHLFHLVNQSWLHLNHQAHCQLSSAKSGQPITCSVISASTKASHIRHARARILSLIGRIGISTREAWKVDACVQLLWDLSNGTYSLHSSDAGHHLKSISTNVSAADKHSAVSERIGTAAREYKHPEPIEAALAQQLVILREFRCSGNEQRLRAVRWLKSAIDNISHNSLTYFMLAYVKSLLELILRNFVGRTKRDYLNELIRTHDLIGQVISSLLRYEQWAMRSHGDLLSSDSLDELGFRHADVIKRHFDLLHYLLRNAEISLSVERAKALWENLIAHSHVTACDREQCFSWFTVSLNHLEPETQTMLFTKMVLKSNPALFRSYAGFEFFKALFEKVNLHEGRMKQVTKTWNVEKPDLIGLDFLWDLYLALPSSDASLDGVHMNPGSTAAQRVADHRHFGSPIDARAPTNGAAERPTAGGTVVSTNQTDPSEYPTGGVEPNAVQLARQLLLDVHWGQLAPRLRRDPEGCYRRFFDSCRRRLECNLAVGRGPAPERGIQSALADTGRLLAAMVVGPGQARRATHCSQTAARLALRRLLGLVYAYIQTVEDELFGARSQHSNWRPHGATYRGWEMQLPLQVETLKPGQINPVPVTSTDGRLKSRSTFAPFIGPAPVGGGILDSSSSSHTVPLLIHSNEMLGSVRERANLIATALLFANRTSQDQCGAGSSAECTNWTTSALYLGPSHFHANGLVCAPGEKPDKSEPYSPFEAASAAVDDKCSLGERSHSKLLLEAVQNRKTVGDIGFETGRVLTVRLVYGLGSRVNSRAGRISVASHMGASSLMLSLGSAGPSVTSFVSRNPSDADLVNRASAALNATAPTQRSRHPISHMADTFMSALSLRKSKESSSVATNLGSSTNSLSTALSVPRGPSLTSLSSSLLPSSSVAAMSSTDLTAITGLAPATVPGHSLPSIYLGEDAGVYELLINLAESELTLSLPTSRSSSTEHKKLRSSVTIQPIGPSLLPSFSLIHPVRLLLATLPTYKSASISLSGNHLQQSLFCSPSNLLKSSPFRTLYKLQMLSSHLIPVDKTAWWDIFPGCLLSPPSQLYFATAVFSNSAIPSGRTSRSSVTSQSTRAISQLNQLVYEGDSPRSCLSPTPTDTKIFLSTDLLGAEVIQSKLCSTSAPSSPVLRRRRNFPTPIATTGSKTPTTSRSSRKNKSALQSAASLVAEVSPGEFLEPLVQLLHRHSSTEYQEFSSLPRLSARASADCLKTQFNNATASSNVAWWVREVRHLCLQLLSFLLNPHGSLAAGLKQSRSTDSDVYFAEYTLPVPMTSTTIAELLTALLETALASAGIADTLLHRERGSKPSQSQTTLNTESAHVPSKDSRAGVAGLIEVITQDGRTILFQDVEVSVQSIRLLFQCVMAYPSHFLEPFLRLEQVESKLFRLLVHSPASRIRNETARQLEHLSLLSSRYLRFGETCVRGRDSSTDSEICLLHNRVYHARLLHFLLRILFHTGLPFYTAHLDLHSKSALTLLMHSSNYFHVRSFLLGQTPASLMNMWFHTDHVKVLWGELNKFQNIVGVESNFSRSKRNLTDCLLAGHLVAASVLCAQAVACVNSHAVCVVHGTAAASSLGFDVHSKSHTGAYPPVCGGMDVPAPIALLDALTTGPDETDHLRPPTSVPGESDNLLGLLPPPDSQSLDETFFINNQIALNACSNCLRVSRNFVHYLIVGCLFPDAAHILHEQSVQHGTDPVPTVDISLSLEPISLRPNSLSGSTDIEAVHKQPCFTIQTVRLLENLGPLTRKAAFDFLLFVSRMDLKSLEKIVDLLILLHHVQNPVQTIHPGAYNLPDSKSGPMTPDKLSGVSSPRSSIGSSTSVRVLRNYRHGSTKELVWDIQPALSGRSDSGFVGLLNGGATCYMNGVLQQLFMQPGLAEALLSVTESDILDEENILFQTQKLFGHLLESQLEYYNPVTFWKSFRPWDTSEAVNPHEQQDAFDFFQALINQLDEELKKLKHEPFFQAIYQGIFLDSKFCDECEHRYDREEVFSAISLAVKAHDLHEALNQFVRGEILDGDNAYYCERCQRKRRTVKRQSVHTLPPVLCLHLKRFDFDWDRQVPVKFSDYFSFPRVLDMSPYMADSVRRLRPEAFLSPVSSASSLLQREAKGTATASTLQDPHSSHDLTKSERRSSTESSKDKACPPSGYTRVPTPVNAQMKSSRSSMRMDMASSSKNPLLQTQEYRYRLVGIVVHSGQANAGHYYSFIKDRGRGEHKCRILVQNMEPPNKVARPVAPSGHTTSTEQEGGLLGQSVRLENTTTSPRHSTTEAPEDDPYDRWYRFNDTSVEPVELTDALLEHECFGGSYSVPNPNGKPPERRSRYWSAYLLFYERVGLNHDALHHILIANRTSAAAMQAKQPHSPVVTSTHGVSSSLFVLDEGPDTGTVATARVPLRFTLSSSMDNVNSGQSEKHGSVSTHQDDTVGEGIDAPEANTMETQATRSGFNMITCPIPHRIAQPIWAENWAFLRDRHIYSRDYFEFIRALCEGILDDVGSLRHQPERAVIGTRLLAHFFFTTFVCLHARSKALITGNLVEGQTMSIQALKELSVQQNSEWLTILLRLASTTPKACRWLMHYLCTSPALPCPVYLLMAPKPATRQQLANMVLTMLRVFYSFKETNILDAVLTRFVNHLLSLLDNGTVADYATEAGALFAMLRGYAEMCPHANLHLINLKATKRILMYLMEPRPPSAIELELTNEEGSSLGICGYDFPTWEDKLRTWTPVQQREMGNLYYLLALLISQTSFDEYRTIKPATPFSSLPPRGHKHLSQTGLHPHHETVRWLGVPLPDSPAQATCNGLTSAPSGGPTQPHIPRSLSVTSDEVYLCGLYRLCEILLRAYVENPTTPSLASSFELPIPIGPCVASSPVTTTASSSVFTTSASPIGATAVIDGVVKTTSGQAAASTGTEGTSLRELIRETILHMIYCSWEASFCIIIALLSKISTRPQSELRHLFDLLNELLRLNDPLQNARISAVVDGLYNSPLPPQYSGCSAPKWCPRPVVDPKLWAWKAEELQRSSASYAGHRPCGGSHGPTNMLPLEEEIHPWPALPRGLLELIITDSCQDARRAYQCMKFIVEVSSETHAVMSYLSRFPDRWEPAVRWLANLLELSDDGGRDLSSQTFSIDQQDSTRGQYRIGEGDAGGLYMVVHSGASGLTDASNESDETNTGFQRTVSAQTTLREATRILFTMPRTTSDSVSVAVPPQTDVSSGVAQQTTYDAVEAESEQLDKAPLFLKLPH